MISFSTIIALLITAFVILLLQGLNGIQKLLVILGASKRRPVDISHLQIRPSDKLQTTIAALLKLGFSRLGELRLKISGQALDGWIFVSIDKSILTEVTEVSPKMVLFTTVYIDDAVVETGFPVGEKIETSNYRSHTIISSIEEAYSHHLKQIADFGQRHGIPRKIETINDYLYWDTVFRKKYVWRKMSRQAWLSVAGILALGYGFVVAMVVVSRLWLQGNNLTAVGLYDNSLFLLKAIAPVALISVIASLVELWGNFRQAKPA